MELTNEELAYFDKRHELTELEAYIRLKINPGITIRKAALEWMWTDKRVRCFLSKIKRDLLCKKEPSKPKKTKEKSKVVSPVTLARNIFEKHYEELTGLNYYWTPKDAVAIKQILEKLKFQRTSKNMTSNDTELLDAFLYLVTNITDEWILKNLSVTIINSKFNEIISQIRNVNRTNRKLNKDDLARAIEDGFNAGIAQLKNK